MLLGLAVVAGEALLGVGDVEPAVHGALHGGEHPGSGGGPGEPHVEAGPEGAGTVVVVLHAVHGAVDGGVALVHGVELELLEDPPGEKQASAVGGGVVGQADLHAVPGGRGNPAQNSAKESQKTLSGPHVSCP